MVLMKGFDARGVRVLHECRERQGAARSKPCHAPPRLFHWKSLRRQVRIRGAVSPVTPEESDRYFASRHPQSRIGAWASAQSRPLDSRATLERATAEFRAKFPGDEIPRPPHWRGFRIALEFMEFWADGAHRLHGPRAVHAPARRIYAPAAVSLDAWMRSSLSRSPAHAERDPGLAFGPLGRRPSRSMRGGRLAAELDRAQQQRERDRAG